MGSADRKPIDQIIWIKNAAPGNVKRNVQWGFYVEQCRLSGWLCARNREKKTGEGSPFAWDKERMTSLGHSCRSCFCAWLGYWCQKRVILNIHIFGKSNLTRQVYVMYYWLVILCSCCSRYCERKMVKHDKWRFVPKYRSCTILNFCHVSHVVVDLAFSEPQ